MLNGKTVFLSGPITGDPDYKEKFAGAETLCLMHGARLVYNPARLKQGKEYRWYMRCCLATIRSGKIGVIVSMPNYWKSPGSRDEHIVAREGKLERFKIEELERQVGE